MFVKAKRNSTLKPRISDNTAMAILKRGNTDCTVDGYEECSSSDEDDENKLS